MKRATKKPRGGSSLPLVSIVMGSQSDWPTLQEAARALDEFGVAYEVDVVSAHRTPRKLYDYANALSSRGLRVVIAGAGGAAHLPGMIASLTEKPVIGVPVTSKALGGLDALLSIAQMPAGVPVATVAIGNAWNAGLLAVQILASGGRTTDVALEGRMIDYKDALRLKVNAQSRALAKTSKPKRSRS